MTVRVVADKPCIVCKGKKRISDTSTIHGGSMTIGGPCPTCDGRGVVSETVTCDSCKSYDRAGFCRLNGDATTPTWGCVSWKEQTP